MANKPKNGNGTKLGQTRKLTTEQQHFIVTRLACYTSIIETQKDFEEAFGFPIERNVVGRYDPTRSYATTLAARLVELFNQIRKDYEAGLLGLHPISKRVYRVEKLGRMFERAMDSKNSPLAAQLLKQAADEMSAIEERKAKDRRYGRDHQDDDGGRDETDTVDEEIELENMKTVLADAIKSALGGSPSSANH